MALFTKTPRWKAAHALRMRGFRKVYNYDKDVLVYEAKTWADGVTMITTARIAMDGTVTESVSCLPGIQRW